MQLELWLGKCPLYSASPTTMVAVELTSTASIAYIEGLRKSNIAPVFADALIVYKNSSMITIFHAKYASIHESQWLEMTVIQLLKKPTKSVGIMAAAAVQCGHVCVGGVKLSYFSVCRL